MRLSDLLSKAPANEEAQVEGFLDGDMRWGEHRTIEVGRVVLNFRCNRCADVRNFISDTQLSCLVVGQRVVSIDTCLKCALCDAIVEAWFLVVARDGLYVQAPTVRLERYVDNRRDVASRLGSGPEEFNFLLERAQVAFEAGLGAGAMVYLRQAFELITKQVALLYGITVAKPVKFGPLLREVNGQHHIIPRAFSEDGYKLFSELSEIVHGNSTESVALRKFRSCEKLVRGVIDNVYSDKGMREAIEDLGWNRAEQAATGEGIAS